MTFNAEQYTEQFKQLMRQGSLWEQLAQPDTEFSKWLSALAEEFARIDARAEELLDETDPRTMYELLYDWEQYLDLPDICVGQLDTLEQRRNAVLEVITSVGGQSKQYFIELALNIGYVITITEFDAFDVTAPVGLPIYGEDWQFAWQVNAPETTVEYFSVGGGANEALASWGNERLECVINSRKPAHTAVLFAYA